MRIHFDEYNMETLTIRYVAMAISSQTYFKGSVTSVHILRIKTTEQLQSCKEKLFCNNSCTVLQQPYCYPKYGGVTPDKLLHKGCSKNFDEFLIMNANERQGDIFIKAKSLIVKLQHILDDVITQTRNSQQRYIKWKILVGKVKHFDKNTLVDWLYYTTKIVGDKSSVDWS